MSYWHLVEKCLIEFHGYSFVDALISVAKFKKKLESEGCDIELISNEEAFYLACSIAGKEVKEPTEEESEIYNNFVSLVLK